MQDVIVIVLSFSVIVVTAIALIFYRYRGDTSHRFIPAVTCTIYIFYKTKLECLYSGQQMDGSTLQATIECHRD